jgi:hypothetical protein
MPRYSVWLAVLLVMAARIVLAVEQDDPPSRLALLVGVGKYQGDALAELPGAPHDVEDVRQLLTTRGFTEAGIKTLVNEQATHQAIVETFQKHLIERAGEQSTVVFYFSGHGSQMADEPGGDETDHFDETLCPYDTRTGNKYDITDDEIAGLLAQLRAKARNVTVIFDSCHSGNATRGLARARSAPPDTRPPPPSPSFAIASHGMVDRDLWGAGQYTFLSGCQSDQESIEAVFNDIPRGLFTYHLINVLRHGSPALTLRDALEEARARVRIRNSNQTPTSEGNLDRIPFGEALPPPRPFFLVVKEYGEYLLKGGKVHGVTVGSEFDLYAPGTKEFTPEKRLCQARILSVDPFTSVLELLGTPPASLELARAVESKHVFVDPPHGVYLRIADAALQSAVKQVVKSVPGVVVTDDGAACRLVITDAGGGPPSPESIRILDASETVEFARMTPAAAGSGTHLAQLLQRFGAWLRAVELHNPTTAFEGEFTVTKVVSKDSDSRGIFTPELTLKVGEKAYIYVKNGSERAFYLYVFDYSSDGSISQVFPESGGPDLIKSGGEYKKRIRATLPAGRESLIEVLKVVVTGMPVDFSAILTNPAKPEAPAPGEFPRAVLSDDWAVTQRVYKVVP